MAYTTDLIRNVAIVGHGGTGKTTLFEHLLFTGGAISRPELVESGKTVSDYMEEEVSHKISVRAAFGHLTHGEKKLNFVDAPGSSDFVGEVQVALRACESALITVDAKSGVQIETVKAWRALNAAGKPRIVYVSKLDDERASFQKALSDVAEKFGVHPVPVTIPMGEGPSFKGVIDVLNQKAYPIPANHDQKESAQAVPAEFADAVNEARSAIFEAAAEGDDELMEKYLGTGELSQEEALKGLALAYKAGSVFPAFAGCAAKNAGTLPLIAFIAETAPSPAQVSPEKAHASDGTELSVAYDPSAAPSGFVLKTQIDQFSGKLSFVKVQSGKFTIDMELTNAREGKREKVAKLYIAQGKKLEEVSELQAGDLGIITKSQSFQTNDTIGQFEKAFSFDKLRLPTPVHALSITASNKKEEDKLSELLHKAAEEDLTFTVRFDPETKETVIAGMGDLQFNLLMDKIKNSNKITVETKLPQVAYRETIQKKSGAEYTHKKQTGGHGQYARVVLEIEPLERGKNYEFENKIFGGAVSRGFMPGIEKGIHQAMERGVVAGYPVVDVKSAITDGKEHPVDSSEMAFKLASRGAFREAMRNANPTLLEPIMNLTVFCEEKNLGDVMSDLSSRRGRISGQNPIGGGIMQIDATVPQAELLRYAIDLRSMTSGTASFEATFNHYEPISGKIAEEVIKNAAKHAEEEEE
jgi:elongation factor G